MLVIHLMREIQNFVKSLLFPSHSVLRIKIIVKEEKKTRRKKMDDSEREGERDREKQSSLQARQLGGLIQLSNVTLRCKPTFKCISWMHCMMAPFSISIFHALFPQMETCVILFFLRKKSWVNHTSRCKDLASVGFVHLPDYISFIGNKRSQINVVNISHAFLNDFCWE